MSEESLEFILCPHCQKKNLPHAVRCVHCGLELENVFRYEGQEEINPDDLGEQGEEDSIPEILQELHGANAFKSLDENITRVESEQKEAEEDSVNRSDSQEEKIPEWLERVRKRAREEEDSSGDLVKSINAMDETRSDGKHSLVDNDFETWIARIREKSRQEQAARARWVKPTDEDSSELPEWLRRIRELQPGSNDEETQATNLNARKYEDDLSRDWTDEELADLRRRELFAEGEEEKLTCSMVDASEDSGLAIENEYAGDEQKPDVDQEGDSEDLSNADEIEELEIFEEGVKEPVFLNADDFETSEEEKKIVEPDALAAQPFEHNIPQDEDTQAFSDEIIAKISPDSDKDYENQDIDLGDQPDFELGPQLAESDLLSENEFDQDSEGLDELPVNLGQDQEIQSPEISVPDRLESDNEIAEEETELPDKDAGQDQISREELDFGPDLVTLRKQQDKAVLLKSVIEQEGKPSRLRKNPDIKNNKQPSRLMVTILLLLFLIISMLIGPSATLENPYTDLPASSFNQTIDDLKSDSSVLVVLDYQAGSAVELEAASLRSLRALEAQVENLTFLTTQVSGLWLGEQLTAAAQLKDDYEINYLPGGFFALLSFTQGSLQEVDLKYDYELTPDGISPLGVHECILIVTDSSDSVRGWMEQISPWLLQTKTIAVIAQKEAALLLPYFDTRQLSGFTTLNLFEETSTPSEFARTFQRPYQAGILLMIVLLILGVISKLENDAIQPKEEDSK